MSYQRCVRPIAYYLNFLSVVHDGTDTAFFTLYPRIDAMYKNNMRKS